MYALTCVTLHSLIKSSVSLSDSRVCSGIPSIISSEILVILLTFKALIISKIRFLSALRPNFFRSISTEDCIPKEILFTPHFLK